MPRRILFALVALIMAAACVGPAGRGPSDNRPPNRPPAGPPYRQGCDVSVIEPTVLPYEEGPPVPPGVARIVGTAIATCDVDPIDHVMHVAVEQALPGGVWAPIEGIGGQLYTECTQKPEPGAPVVCDHIIPCDDGEYRTSVTVLGVDERGPFTFSPPEQPSARVRCPA